MQNRGITLSQDWTRVEIELELKSNYAEQVAFGGLLVGEGQMWFDSLELSLDGEPLEAGMMKNEYRAEKDHRFNNGSSLDALEIKNHPSENLALLGRVWGFLKYHHGEIAQGKYHWDYELIARLPAYLKLSTAQDRDKFLLNWINNLGAVPECSKCPKTQADAKLKPDLNWLDHFSLMPALKQRLISIHKNRHLGKHYYIDYIPQIGNPVFKNEESYADMPYPDAAFRLLALYRYWNIINYYFPYKYLTNTPWDKVLSQYLNEFIQAENELEYEQAVTKLIAEVNDSHAKIYYGNNAIQQKTGNFYPPVHVRFLGHQLIVTDYYGEEQEISSKLRVGDIITKINGVGIADIIANSTSLYPASNPVAQMRDLASDILRANSQYLDIEYQRNANTSQERISLYQKHQIDFSPYYPIKQGAAGYRWLEQDILYIDLKSFTQTDIQKIAGLLDKSKGVIIDIRGYPASFVPFSLGRYFISGSRPFVTFTTANMNNPGEFNFNQQPFRINNPSAPYTNKLAILVNEYSQSQSEYTAMAFQAGINTTVIGSQTAGADGNVSTIELPGGIQTAISGIGIYYPDGTETQRIGIVPDITIQPTLESIKTNTDLILETAIKFITKNP
ncbi:S41 family peptidase [Thalassomonas haliotis]|uniref:Peptidase S41 n=1 Tax=Thalassomonas haliotis TaxID=485448 RepID=A0ABY7VCY2_9GAMM|nr:S41 family peptidase [Thalassomonas haliotis]WDE10752.1 peptidase S41 [Thalassomonas haliotis]